MRLCLRLVIATSLALLAVVLLHFQPLFSAPLQTDVSGTISANTTWTLAASPYTLTTEVTVNAGVTLTVEPGVVIYGKSGTGLIVKGALLAQGIEAQPILFTSSSNSAAGQWKGLLIQDGSAQLEQVTVRYGGQFNGFSQANVTIYSGGSSQVSIKNSTISNAATSPGSLDHGIYIRSSRVTIDTVRFENNGNSTSSPDYALFATDGSTITVTNSIFTDNQALALRVEADSVQRISGNTFSGNQFNRILIEAGEVANGATLSAQSGLEAYELEGGLIVPTGATLNIAPGVVLRGRSSAGLVQVKGVLSALGTASQPITFTSASDSGAGQWKGLLFENGSGQLRHVIVRYGGQFNGFAQANVTIYSGGSSQVTLEKCTISSAATSLGSTDNGIFVRGSQLSVSDSLFTDNGNPGGTGDFALYATDSSVVTVTNSSFENNNAWAIRTEAESVHHLTGNTFSGNYRNRIVVEGGNVVDGATLSAQSGLQAYELEGVVLVPSGSTLTIAAGVQVRARSSVALLEIEGTLNALGTAAKPITFTSASDSGAGQWKGLLFENGSGQLEHVTVRYGGQFNGFSQANITIYSDGSSQVQIAKSHVISAATSPGSTDHGIFVHNSHLTLSDSLIGDNGNNNVAGDYGLYATAASVVTITSSSISDNLGAHGLGLDGSTLVAQCVSFARNKFDGLRLTGVNSLKLIASSIVGNGGFGLRNTHTTPVDAPYNWWGDASGPFHVALNPLGAGSEISDNVAVTPWLPSESCAVADLSVTASDTPDPAVVGSLITYTINVSNIIPFGDLPATGILLTDTLPGGFKVASATPLTQVEAASPSAPSCSSSGNKVTCALGTLNRGQSIAVRIVGTATITGTFFNTLVVTGSAIDPSPNDNQFSHDTVVIASINDPAIATFVPETLRHGDARELDIFGQNFSPTATVALSGDRNPAGQIEVLSRTADSHIKIKVDIASYEYFGAYTVTVRNANGQSAVRPILIVPSILYPETRGMGTLGFPVGVTRTNYLEVSNIANDDGMVWLVIEPPQPGLINLSIGQRFAPLWDSSTAISTTAHILLSLKEFESYRLQMNWNVPPGNVIFPNAAGLQTATTFAPHENIIFNQNQPVSWKGLKGATKAQFKNMAKAVLLGSVCEKLGQKLGGVEVSLLDAALDDAIDQLEGATTPENVLTQVGEFLGEKTIPGFGQVKFATEIGACLGQLVNGVFEAFNMAAKAAADRLRARSNGNQDLAFLNAIEGINKKAKLNAYTALAVTKRGGLVDQLSKPPCNPGLSSPGSYNAPVRGPWDPNDKTPYTFSSCEAGLLDGELVCLRYLIPPLEASAPISYVIQFENKKEATAPAENVVISDVLDAKLSAASLEIIASSHPVSYSVAVAQNTVVFRFLEIALPPNKVAPEGEGYVIFAVSPKTALAIEAEVRNSASIVFDFNPPIVTPTLVHVVKEPSNERKVFLPVVSR